MTRRLFLASVPAAALAAQESPVPKLKLSVFSKHLQWAKWDEMAAVAVEAGFEGVDLTVRPGGHVLPERVGDDLPQAVQAVRKAGIDVTMITTAIVDAESPHAAAILKAAAGLGIRFYRWGGMKYDDATPIPQQLRMLRDRVKALADLNQEYGMTAMYHTHSGMEVGAPIWDLWEIMRDYSARWVGINYDIGHATVEGGLGGWIRSAQVSRPYIRGVALKDFLWKRNAKGAWAPEWVPAGMGMVDFGRFFQFLRESQFEGPVQVHYEYEGLGGADGGRTELSIPKREFIAKIRRDVDWYRARMREAGLA